MKVVASLLVAIAACQSGSDTKPAPEKTAPPAPGLAAGVLPAVREAAAVATARPAKPPVLVIVDRAGSLHVAFVERWDDVALRTTPQGAYPAHPEALRRYVKDGPETGETMRDVVARFALTEDPQPPPAPPELDKPDDGADEIGYPPDGVWRNPDFSSAESRAAQRRADDEAARRAKVKEQYGVTGPAGALVPFNPEADLDNVSVVAGRLAADGRIDERTTAVVLAPPEAPARALIEAVAATEGAIAVAHDGGVRLLRRNFRREADAHDLREPRDWLELRVGAQGLWVEAVPDAPLAVKGDAIAAALDTARTGRALPARTRVDVLVEPGISAQRLVDVLVALDRIGIEQVALGEAPAAGSPAAAQRGTRRPIVVLGVPNTQGEVDRLTIRRHMQSIREQLRACYAAALLKTPTLAGTLNTQVFITPKGTVGTANAAGVDPGLAQCVAGELKKLVFPASAGATQFVFPMTFRT